MPANSWAENDSYSELEALGSLLSELSEDESELETLQTTSLKTCGEGRRRKAAVVFIVVWSGTIALHLISVGFWLVLGLTTLWGIHTLRLVLARPRTQNAQADYLPSVSLLVAAKNEEAVIGNLVKTLCSLDYPVDRYEVWVIDDNSTDQTPALLEKLQQNYDKLKVLRRGAEASGGKSGALNQVLPLTKGEILAVFDADAQVTPDLLQRVLPLFQKRTVGAVQVRKAIANSHENFWTRGQMAEMAVDSYVQQQRVALGGIGELRGNGQFVRRHALERCGGWNEETITDDLDLTLRLHLDNWEIEFVSYPYVEEEGVTNAIALWHQRNRWAEGGYQRYLDYWRLIIKSRIGAGKKFDLLMFMLIQYIVPIAQVPDFLMAIARNRLPVLTPLTSFTVTIFMIWMFLGLKRIRTLEDKLTWSALFVILLQTLRGTLYMCHWMVVMASTTARMSVRPKRLKWVKTVHQGNN
ncbi:glycosyltransferase [Chroogloeocystis siderophila]|jgi:1,2-diacylglycerol 3-beta-glucosyltransferase|uniref:Beta-monoglucosyldiacylglycerol synthase n=1 Tax=Chroogloeocystis siderophila 5.2 s.c.1 TaxID=247279 RepID=A0A1U7HXC6_9CHRO|nr:glycosyltransferase family 2 protein [Chroogloeocystis siderophila]OKH28201.1 glycosyl transferase [Chroogloeocystis siderophila 5.2 s.c.1]